MLAAAASRLARRTPAAARRSHASSRVLAAASRALRRSVARVVSRLASAFDQVHHLDRPCVSCPLAHRDAASLPLLPHPSRLSCAIDGVPPAVLQHLLLLCLAAALHAVDRAPHQQTY